MNTFSDHLHSLHHSDSDPLVRKLGGSTTARLQESIRRLRSDQRKGFTAVTLSALRSEEIPLTTNLLDLANRLSDGTTENIEHETRYIGYKIRDLLEKNRLLTDGRPTPNLFMDLEKRLDRVRRGETFSVEERGSDRILAMGDERLSLLGQGEMGTMELYRMFLERNMSAFDLHGLEDVLHRTPDIRSQRDMTRGMLMFHLQECQRQGKNRTLVPGYLPHTARSRGYSDTTAVEVAIALRDVHQSQAACSIEKDLPLLTGMPEGQCVSRITYEEAGQRCSSTGSAAGVVHPDAINLGMHEGIPIIVHNPMKPELGATLIH